MKTLSKTYMKIISGVLTIFILIGCSADSVNIEKISLTDSNTEYDVHETYEIGLNIQPNDANSENLKFISSDEDIVELNSIDNSKLIINTLNEGEATIYVKADEIISNVLNINVIDQERIAQEKAEEERLAQQKAEEERIAQEQAQKEAEQQAQNAGSQTGTTQNSQSNSTTSNNSASQEITSQQPVTQTVWIASSGNGTKYHSNPNCSNMKNPIELSIEDAEAKGYTPCKKCY